VSQQATEPPASPSQSQDDPSPGCDPGTSITDLGAELHDGDWGHGSIMIHGWIPMPIKDLDAVLDYTTTSGTSRHVDEGIVAHQARSSCGAVVIVGFDVDDFLQIEDGSVTITDITYEDGTTETGPLVVPFELQRLEQ
jgi:hypothetical protein